MPPSLETFAKILKGEILYIGGYTSGFPFQNLRKSFSKLSPNRQRYFLTIPEVPLFIVLLTPCFASADRNQVGDIQFESAPAEMNPYERSQNSAIEHFRLREKEAKVGVFSQTTLGDGAINYLSAVYLFCSIRQGTCPEVLEGILESDVINAQLSGKFLCPQMKNFWKSWIANDFEKRQQYNVSTGYLETTTKFRKESRPKYIKCEETLQELAPKVKDSLSSRYSGAKAVKSNVFSQLAQLLEHIKEKVSDVFVAVGAKGGAKADLSSAKKPDKDKPASFPSRSKSR